MPEKQNLLVSRSTETSGLCSFPAFKKNLQLLELDFPDRIIPASQGILQTGNGML